MRGKMFSPAILAQVHVEGQVFFLMSSLSLRLLERCKVCLFKTTPFSLCQKKITAVHKATFYFILVVLFLFFLTETFYFT